MTHTIDTPNPEEVRRIIRALNLMDLDKAEFDEITKSVHRLTTGYATRVVAVRIPNEIRLYRARKNPPEGKPLKIGQLGPPHPAFVTGYQRCNKPGEPMFYCSRLPVAAMLELNVGVGDVVYVSTWTVEHPFIYNAGFTGSEMCPTESNHDTIATFFETKFCQPVHQTYSNQYKITAAITHVLTSGNVCGTENYSDHVRSASPRGIGGITYPSVAHVGRSPNFAIKPRIVEECMKLSYVEEWVITDRADQTISFERKDLAIDFADGSIRWTGKTLHWKLNGPVGQVVTATAEADGWVLRDETNQIIKPG